MTVENISWSISTKECCPPRLGWTRDLLVSSWTAHPTEPATEAGPAFQNDKIIIRGDWNLVINPDLDTKNYLHINNPRACQEVLNMIDEEEFVDIYRVLNGDKREFTWSRRNPVRKQARLDFFLINDDCLPYAFEAKIIPGYRSDHSGIVIELALNTNERGRGYWKFNNSY